MSDNAAHFRERAEISMYWYDEDDEKAKEVLKEAMSNLMIAFKRAGVRFPAIHLTGRK
jgi:hypothetical protein